VQACFAVSRTRGPARPRARKETPRLAFAKTQRGVHIADCD
jgi:hypothetical protein